MLSKLKWFTGRSNTIISSLRNNKKNQAKGFSICYEKPLTLGGLMKHGPRPAVPCSGDQVSLAWLLGQGSLQGMIHSATWRVLAKGMRWRTWAVLKTCQRSNNLLRELISAVNYPCDQNESPTVFLKSGFCLSNLCPVLLSRDTDSWLFPSSLQYTAMPLSNFVLFSPIFF